MFSVPIAISTLAIVLIVFAVVIGIALILGWLGIRARNRRRGPWYAEHVAAADAALEQARAGDKGWHRESMERVAREALERSRPGWAYRQLHLILVDDRPGVSDDRAQFMAVADDDEARVILARVDDRWVAERV